MANIKISELPEKTDAPSNDDLLVIEDQEDTKKITLQKLKGDRKSTRLNSSHRG